VNRPIAARVTRGTAAVAAASALILAAASGLIARVLWRAEERAALDSEARALSGHIAREEREHAGEEREHAGADARVSGASFDEGVRDALMESLAPGYRAEVWRGDRLLAASATGPALGPLSPEEGMAARGDWTASSVRLSGGGLLVVGVASDHGRRALRVFLLSLALAAPLCLGVALWVGRRVAGRATRPLLDLQGRIRALRPLHALPPSPSAADDPAEVHDLEEAFRGLWSRLDAALLREREFVANASHELRLPLARIRLQAERALAQPDQASAALAAQVEEVDHLVRLVDSLLVLSRDAAPGRGQGEAVNLADVARRVATRVMPAEAAARCALPDEAFVRGDEALIEIALQNLLDNARKFAVGAPVGAELDERDGRLRLQVTTPGARIANDDRERVFDRFYRGPDARARAGGHGLGLALARHIARLHAGDVRCVSDEREDVRFVLELPAWTAAIPAD
jgi:signal transduction histidine kinase